MTKKHFSLLIMLVFALSPFIIKAESQIPSVQKEIKKIKDWRPETDLYKEKEIENEAEDERDDSIENDDKKIEKETFEEKIKDFRKETKERFDIMREEIKKEKDSIKMKISEARLENREKALEKFNNALDRVKNLRNRLNEQIKKVEALKIDTTLAKANVAMVDEKLKKAEENIIKINTILATKPNEITPETKKLLKTLSKETEDLLKLSYGVLRDTVKSLKEPIKNRNLIKVENKTN